MTAALFCSARLSMRLWRRDDAEAGFELWGDPEVMRHIEPAVSSLAEVIASIDAGRRHFDEHGVQHFALEHPSAGVIGCCGFNAAEGDADFELVFHIARQHWGRGFASEAAKSAVDWLQATRPGATIEAATVKENIGAQRVLERAGLRLIEERWFDDTQRFELCYLLDQSALNS